jgi:hypothetical protein
MKLWQAFAIMKVYLHSRTRVAFEELMNDWCFAFLFLVLLLYASHMEQ